VRRSQLLCVHLGFAWPHSFVWWGTPHVGVVWCGVVWCCVAWRGVVAVRTMCPRGGGGVACVPVVDAVEGVYDFPGSRRTSTARARASKPDRLTARDPRAAPVVDSAAGLFSPYISMALGIDSGAVVMVSPYCTNGSLPTSTLSCPVAITSVDVTLAEVNTSNTWTLSVDFNATTCPCTSQGCVCTLGTGSLVNYVQYSVSAVTKCVRVCVCAVCCGRGLTVHVLARDALFPATPIRRLQRLSLRRPSSQVPLSRRRPFASSTTSQPLSTATPLRRTLRL